MSFGKMEGNRIEVDTISSTEFEKYYGKLPPVDGGNAISKDGIAYTAHRRDYGWWIVMDLKQLGTYEFRLLA